MHQVGLHRRRSIYGGTLLLVLLSNTKLILTQADVDPHHMLRRAQECASFMPMLCATSPSAAVKNLHCPACQFDVKNAFGDCPIVAAGFYSYSTGTSEGGGCPDPFMAQTYRPPPPCGSRCCRTAHEGSFTIFDDWIGGGTANVEGFAERLPSRLEFQPTDSSCRYKLISRGQLMQFMAQNNSSLLFVGDSTQRQLFLRLIAMLRGQSQLVDFHAHTHCSYHLCREVDMLRIAAPNPTGVASPSDSNFLKSINPAFFQMKVGPGQADGRRILSECTHSPLRIDFVQAPKWTAQMEALNRYLDGLPKEEHLVLVISMGLWEEIPDPPMEYLEALDVLGKSGKVLRVFYIGVPTSMIINRDRRRELEERNQIMRDWIEKHQSIFAWVDFDALTQADGGPKGTPGSKHFACWLEWEDGAKFPIGASGNPAGSAQLTGKVVRIHQDVEGHCADEMNRNLMQILLNGMINNAALSSWSSEEEATETETRSTTTSAAP